jgi:DnaB-like helicase C terminal domain
MTDNKTRIEIERDFISLLLKHKVLVDEWVSDGPDSQYFDEIHHPILHSIEFAARGNSLLTRRAFIDNLRNGPLSKLDIGAQEGQFNVISSNVSNVKKDDFVHLRNRIRESYILRNIASYVDGYRQNIKDKGGIFSAQKLSSQINALVSGSDVNKQAIYQDVCDYAPEYILELEAKAARGSVDVVSCGIREIDSSMVVGFAPGTLTLFCGDVGSYKSTIMMNVGIDVWKLKEKNVLIVPLEMPREKWFQKMYSRETGIPFTRLETPSLLTEAEKKKIDETHKQWQSWSHRFYIMETPERITVSYLRREIEKHIEIFKPDLIVVDYIANLLPEQRNQSERDDLKIGQMLKDLRQMGKPGAGVHKSGFGIVSGAQIGREGLKRVRKVGATKTGFYSEDLRGSHEYAADSDNIFAQMKDPNNADRLHFYILKTRYGTGVFPNGANRTSLLVRGDIGLIRSESNDWVDKIKQDEILKKIDDPIEDFDPLNGIADSSVVTDDDVWGSNNAVAVEEEIKEEAKEEAKEAEQEAVVDESIYQDPDMMDIFGEEK